jgi:DNA topoisomerase VI subunit B
MKYCLSELYRKVSAQIRKELRMKEAQGRLNLYKYYIPLVVSAISESIRLDSVKLEQAFTMLAEKHVKGELSGVRTEKKEDRITGERLEEEAEEAIEIDSEVVKSDKEQQQQKQQQQRREQQQIAISSAGKRKFDKPTKSRINKKKIPETLRKDKKPEQESSQTTLDKVVVVEDAKPRKGRKSK